jgi:hypothetical protein
MYFLIKNRILADEEHIIGIVTSNESLMNRQRITNGWTHGRRDLCKKNKKLRAGLRMSKKISNFAAENELSCPCGKEILDL